MESVGTTNTTMTQQERFQMIVKFAEPLRHMTRLFVDWRGTPYELLQRLSSLHTYTKQVGEMKVFNNCLYGITPDQWRNRAPKSRIIAELGYDNLFDHISHAQPDIYEHFCKRRTVTVRQLETGWLGILFAYSRIVENTFAMHYVFNRYLKSILFHGMAPITMIKNEANAQVFLACRGCFFRYVNDLANALVMFRDHAFILVNIIDTVKKEDEKTLPFLSVRDLNSVLTLWNSLYAFQGWVDNYVMEAEKLLVSYRMTDFYTKWINHAKQWKEPPFRRIRRVSIGHAVLPRVVNYRLLSRLWFETLLNEIPSIVILDSEKYTANIKCIYGRGIIHMYETSPRDVYGFFNWTDVSFYRKMLEKTMNLDNIEINQTTAISSDDTTTSDRDKKYIEDTVYLRTLLSTVCDPLVMIERSYEEDRMEEEEEEQANSKQKGSITSLSGYPILSFRSNHL